MFVAGLVTLVLVLAKVCAVGNIPWAVVLVPLALVLGFRLLLQLVALFAASWLAMRFYQQWPNGRVPPKLRKPLDQNRSRATGYRVH
jgi:hypothetical protein